MQRFVKLLSATSTETLELILSPERHELKRQLSGLGEDGVSEKCFIEAALEELKVGFASYMICLASYLIVCVHMYVALTCE